MSVTSPHSPPPAAGESQSASSSGLQSGPSNRERQLRTEKLEQSKRLAELSKSNAELSKSNAELSKSNADLEGQLLESEETVQSLTDALTQAAPAAKVAHLETRIDELESENRDLRRRLEASDQLNISRDEELQQLRSYRAGVMNLSMQYNLASLGRDRDGGSGNDNGGSQHASSELPKGDDDRKSEHSHSPESVTAVSDALQAPTDDPMLQIDAEAPTVSDQTAPTEEPGLQSGAEALTVSDVKAPADESELRSNASAPTEGTAPSGTDEVPENKDVKKRFDWASSETGSPLSDFCVDYPLANKPPLAKEHPSAKESSVDIPQLGPTQTQSAESGSSGLRTPRKILGEHGKFPSVPKPLRSPQPSFTPVSTAEDWQAAGKEIPKQDRENFQKSLVDRSVREEEEKVMGKKPPPVPRPNQIVHRVEVENPDGSVTKKVTTRMENLDDVLVLPPWKASQGEPTFSHKGVNTGPKDGVTGTAQTSQKMAIEPKMTPVEAKPKSTPQQKVESMRQRAARIDALIDQGWGSDEAFDKVWAEEQAEEKAQKPGQKIIDYEKQGSETPKAPATAETPTADPDSSKASAAKEAPQQLATEAPQPSVAAQQPPAKQAEVVAGEVKQEPGLAPGGPASYSGAVRSAPPSAASPSAQPTGEQQEKLVFRKKGKHGRGQGGGKGQGGSKGQGGGKGQGGDSENRDCPSCHKQVHTMATCPHRGSQGGFRARGGDRGSVGGQRSGITPGVALKDNQCKRCGELGHWQAQCPNRPNGGDRRGGGDRGHSGDQGHGGGQGSNQFAALAGESADE